MGLPVRWQFPALSIACACTAPVPPQADHEKYQLYMEATLLEQIAYSLEFSRAQLRETREGVEEVGGGGGGGRGGGGHCGGTVRSCRSCSFPRICCTRLHLVACSMAPPRFTPAVPLPPQIKECYSEMKAKHSELSKHIAALQGIEEWRVEAVQLDHVSRLQQMQAVVHAVGLGGPGY